MKQPIHNTYDRLGRMTAAIATGVSTNLFTYDGFDLVSETQNGAVISRETEVLGRPTGFAISNSPYAISYSYDAYGRFSAVTAQVHVLTHGYVYGYLADSDLVETMANTHGHTVTRTYDAAMPHITRVHNGFTGGRTVSQYDYAYDALGRRTAIANSGEAFTFSNANDLAAFNLYDYNGRSEVTGAARYWGTDTGDTSEAVDGQQYAYAFDPIGNRVTAAEGDTSRTATYTANALNQYSQRTVPGVKELAGTALTNATVTVNDLPADRHGPWWRHAFEADNGSSAAYTQAVVTAVYSNLYSSATGHVFVAETPEAFAYDYDGNLTQDGRFDYAWDAENRLASATTRDDLPAAVPRIKVDYLYDHQSRRIASATAVWTNDAWQATESRSFLYDGWNVVTERTHSQTHTFTNLYTWGLDLSGSLQGAGGVGGLLAASLDGTTALYCYDANGNVGQLVSTDGELLAHYEYSPFGEMVVSTGPLAEANPFRFSTKWFDNDTGLGYWGYRWYSPSQGRWISLDLIDFGPDLSLYAAFQNSPSYRVDLFGLASITLTPATKIPVPGPFHLVYPEALGDHDGKLDPKVVGVVDPSSQCKCRFTVGPMEHSGKIIYRTDQSADGVYLTILEETMHHKIAETVAYFVAAGSTTQRSCKYPCKQTKTACEAKAKSISTRISAHYGYHAVTLNRDEFDKSGKPKGTKEELMALFKDVLTQALALQGKTDDWKCPK